MQVLTKNELLNISGGAGWLGIAAAFAGALSFFVGFLDGLTRPFKCR